MAIKIKKNGKIENFTLHSTDVKVLDLEGKFKKKDLESVIREISDTEHIHIGEVDTSKDGIWIDDGEILDNSENNGVVEKLKEYINEQVGDKSKLITNTKEDIISAINENRQEIIKRKDICNGNWFTDNGITNLDVVHSNVQAYTTAAAVTDGLPNGMNGGGGFFKCEVTYRSGVVQNAVQTFIHTASARIFKRTKNNPSGGNPNEAVWVDWKEISNNSNPNLLINGDFQVWQRGTSFSPANNKYTVDRWAMKNGISVSKQGTTLYFKGTGQVNGTLWQPLEEYAKYKGKTVTSSAMVKGTGKIRLMNFGGQNPYKEFTLTNQWQLITLTTTNSVINNTTMGEIGVVLQLIGSTDECYVQWIKLELGSVATPFVSRSFGEELVLCKRYFERLGNGNDEYLCPITMVGTNAYEGGITCEVTKRLKSPTITFRDVSKFRVRHWGGAGTVTTMRGGSLDGRHIILVGTANVDGSVRSGHLQRQDGTLLAYIDVDSEIY